MFSRILSWLKKTRSWRPRRSQNPASPVRRIIGDLSDREQVLIGLDLLYDELADNSLTWTLMDALEDAGTTSSDS